MSTPYLISGGPDCHIRRVRCVKYLGIIVNGTLTWVEHIEYISVKIKRGIGILKVTGKFLKRETLILIYRTLIEPYLRYCSIVWGQCNETQKDKLQALRNKAARTIAKVKGPVKLIKRVKIAYSFLVCVKSVPRYHFKLAYVILQMAVKEVFETHFQKWRYMPF